MVEPGRYLAMRLQLRSGCASNAIPEVEESPTQLTIRNERIWNPDEGQENQEAMENKEDRGAGFSYIRRRISGGEWYDGGRGRDHKGSATRASWCYAVALWLARGSK